MCPAKVVPHSQVEEKAVRKTVAFEQANENALQYSEQDEECFIVNELSSTSEPGEANEHEQVNDDDDECTIIKVVEGQAFDYSQIKVKEEPID